MDSDHRLKAYRFVAYSAVTFSVVAVLSVCVTLPMVYNYVSHVKRSVNTEIRFCKQTASDIWGSVTVMKNQPANRTARQAGYGDEGVDGGNGQVGHGGGGGGGKRLPIKGALQSEQHRSIMDLDQRLKAYRFVAYSAVTFSVVAVLSICITLPMVYNYVHQVKRSVDSEIRFCKQTANDIWGSVNVMKNMPAGNRTARQAGYGDEGVDAGNGQVGHGGGGGGGKCGGCCLPGPPGA
ncbi:unnamed protein product, partial [Nippostrongylus brasiliensis]|uniref:Col_cuticle_N domain-containing protein n=1 Tax=Nippostrongylus brasiliensis TaxID=27835 RepID=A0A0N4YLR9_NIPBR